MYSSNPGKYRPNTERDWYLFMFTSQHLITGFSIARFMWIHSMPIYVWRATSNSIISNHIVINSSFIWWKAGKKVRICFWKRGIQIKKSTFDWYSWHTPNRLYDTNVWKSIMFSPYSFWIFDLKIDHFPFSEPIFVLNAAPHLHAIDGYGKKTQEFRYLRTLLCTYFIDYFFSLVHQTEFWVHIETMKIP